MTEKPAPRPGDDHDHGQCGTGPEDCWQNPMGDPIMEWMQANRIDLERIPMFPEIELRGDEMLIEYFYGREEEHRTRPFLFFHKHLPTRMVRKPVLVPMDPVLWEVYERARNQYRLADALEGLGKAGATVLTAKPGAHLVFVCSNPMVEDPDFLETASRVLQEALPGVGVQIMTGVDTILHRAPQEG